jgi:hypothetical protein
MHRPSPTSLFLALLLLLTLWNSCSARRIANQVDFLVKQVDSVEGKTNGLISDQEEMKSALDEVKTSVDENCGD